MEHSSDTTPNRYTILERYSKGLTYVLFCGPLKDSSQTVTVEFQRINYNYTLHLSLRLTGYGLDRKNLIFRESVIETPLTVAYI